MTYGFKYMKSSILFGPCNILVPTIRSYTFPIDFYVFLQLTDSISKKKLPVVRAAKEVVD